MLWYSLCDGAGMTDAKDHQNLSGIYHRSWQAKKASTKGRKDINGDPIEMRITFDQWCELWKNHGKVPGAPWVVSRKNDIGHYEIGNVEIVHNIENIMQTLPHNDLDHRITEYAIKHKMSRRIVKAMLKRNQIKL